MDELKRLPIFNKVVDAGSFSEAARQLGIAKSAVSKQISSLEKDLGIRLLNRSTRSISLTEAGKIYYSHAAEIVERASIARNELIHYKNQPSGTLKIASPVSFGISQVVPIISELHSLYPKLKIELLFEDSVINPIEEGVDIAIRVGWLQESNLVAKKLCNVPLVLFSSPEYLATHGPINTPKDLINHNFIGLSLFSSPLKWCLKKESKEELITMQSSIKTNSVQALVSLVKKGMGISIIAKYNIEKLLIEGQVLKLLEGYSLTPSGIYAVYPHRDHVPAKVRIFLEFIEKRCKNSSWSL